VKKATARYTVVILVYDLASIMVRTRMVSERRSSTPVTTTFCQRISGLASSQKNGRQIETTARRLNSLSWAASCVRVPLGRKRFASKSLNTANTLVPAPTGIPPAPTAEQKHNEKNDQYSVHLNPP